MSGLVEGGVYASSDGTVADWAKDNPKIEVPAPSMDADFSAACQGPSGLNGPTNDLSLV